MFAYINGFLEDVTVDNAVIDVNGFGINVRISADTASKLPGIGKKTAERLVVELKSEIEKIREQIQNIE